MRQSQGALTTHDKDQITSSLDHSYPQDIVPFTLHSASA